MLSEVFCSLLDVLLKQKLKKLLSFRNFSPLRISWNTLIQSFISGNLYKKDQVETNAK